MECCEGGAINEIMKAVNSPLTEAEAKEVVAYILLALQHIHQSQILHRVSRDHLYGCTKYLFIQHDNVDCSSLCRT
jgi:hypothetical protein